MITMNELKKINDKEIELRRTRAETLIDKFIRDNAHEIIDGGAVTLNRGNFRSETWDDVVDVIQKYEGEYIVIYDESIEDGVNQIRIMGGAL